MPILPVVDLLILIGSGLLFAGALLKAVYVTTNYRPTLLGLGPMECAIGAAVFLLLVLVAAGFGFAYKKYQDLRKSHLL